MCASPLSFFRAGPPPPNVALLPDALFFSRAVPITKGATAAEATTQAELALEAIAPFPLAQLYYGTYWVPGAETAFVFASYRRRFTSEQTAAWANAEVVLPAFASVLGANVEPATTIILHAPEALTAVHWATAPIPAKVLVHALSPEASDEDRLKARDALLRQLGGTLKVLDLTAPPVADSGSNDREFTFRSGEFVATLPAAIAARLDVRDKAELAALRQARQRDVLLWRVVLGSAAALVLLFAGELALMGGRAWQQVRVRQYRAQKPLVDKIEATHELTSRIQDLRTKRLLPMEMMGQAVGENLERKPPDIIFTRVHAEQGRGLYTLFIEGKTENVAQVNAYEAALKALPSVQSAEAKFSQVSGARATFALVVIFKPEALKPIGSPVASAP